MLRYTLFIDEENAVRRAKKVAAELPTLQLWAKNDRHATEASVPRGPPPASPGSKQLAPVRLAAAGADDQ
jgi:hypothetical protein